MKKEIFSSTIRSAVVACALLLPVIAQADVSPLTQDAYINPGSGLNFGGLVTLNVGGATNSQALLQFDVTALTPPSGGTVAWARLRLYVNKVNAAGAVDIFAANASWSESTVSGVGGPGPGTLVAAGVPISATGYVTVDVTGQVIAWLTGSPNNGLILVANPASTNVVLDSKENASTSHPASLEVVFTGPAGTPGAAGAAGATGPSGPSGAPGLAGAAGAGGASGPAGATGPSGAPGAVGLAGAQGPSGPQGDTGPTGPSGASGPSGPSGPSGAAGTSGALGPSGPSGPSGASGPSGVGGVQGPSGPSGAAGVAFSNTQATATITNGATISNTDTHVVFYINNAGGPVSMTLPLANVPGKLIRVQATVASGNSVTVNRQGTDLLFEQVFPTSGVTSLGTTSSISFVSDGAGRWLQLWRR
jgi:hypothetical protein